MKLLRIGVAWSLVLGLSTAGFAGDLRESIAKAATQQTEQPPSNRMPASCAWAGGTLFAAGMAMTLYGFLHTSGGEFVSGQVSKESKTTLGGVGLAVAGAGGAILFYGSHHKTASPSIALGPGRIAVAKHVGW